MKNLEMLIAIAGKTGSGKKTVARKIGYQIGNSYTYNKIPLEIDIGKNIIISNLRLKEDAEKLKHNNFYIIRVDCPKEIREQRTYNLNEADILETDMDNYRYDYVIINDGNKDDLFMKVGNMLKELKYKR